MIRKSSDSAYIIQMILDVEKRLTNEIREGRNRERLISPRRFSELTGIKYTTVIHYLNINFIKGMQKSPGSAWLIPIEEVDRMRNESRK